MSALEKVLVINEERKNILINTDFLDELDKAIETVKPLVFPATEDGGKESKKTTASIRKYAKAVKAQVDGEFKEKTSTLTEAKTLLISKVKELNEIAKGIDDQQAERITKKLEEIRELLQYELAHAWNNAGVRNEYQSDLSVLDKAVIISSLTPKGALTKKAKDYVQTVCEQNKNKQSAIDSRLVILENKCMKAGVDASALTREYIGPDFFAADDIFEARVDELLAIEVQKKEAAEKRAKEEKQKAVDAALAKQQAEADRLAQEKAQQQTSEPTPEAKPETTEAMAELPSKIPQNVRQQMDADRAQAEVQQSATVTPIKTEQKDINGKHPVHITFTVEKMIRDDVSDEAVADHFMFNVLPDDIRTIVVHYSAITANNAKKVR